MNQVSFGLVIVFSIACVSMAFAADEPQVCDSKTVDGFVQILKGTGSKARNPTIEELFDAFNGTATLLADLKYEENNENRPTVSIEAPNLEPILYTFDTAPKRTVGGDRFCKKKNETRIGYECRLDFIRKDKDLGGLPNGLNSGVQIKIPLSDPQLVSRVSNALGCGEIVEASGKPVLQQAPTKTAAARPVDKSAAASGKAATTAPNTKAPTNVVPAIQLQGAPKPPAASAPAQTAPTAKTQR